MYTSETHQAQRTASSAKVATLSATNLDHAWLLPSLKSLLHFAIAFIQ